ncbi:MAG: hypothetical protein WCA00_18870 [Candidatus Acidiferrales bacterium]
MPYGNRWNREETLTEMKAEDLKRIRDRRERHAAVPAEEKIDIVADLVEEVGFEARCVEVGLEGVSDLCIL